MKEIVCFGDSNTWGYNPTDKSRYPGSVRWTGVLQRDQRRRHDDPGAGQPIWLRPEGRRQERALASFSAAALWGEAFTAALAHACRRHFDAGLDGDWREYLLTVPAV